LGTVLNLQTKPYFNIRKKLFWYSWGLNTQLQACKAGTNS
jgi:hypothetical protein